MAIHATNPAPRSIRSRILTPIRSKRPKIQSQKPNNSQHSHYKGHPGFSTRQGTSLPPGDFSGTGSQDHNTKPNPNVIKPPTITSNQLSTTKPFRAKFQYLPNSQICSPKRPDDQVSSHPASLEEDIMPTNGKKTYQAE